MQFVGHVSSGGTFDAFAFNAAGEVWNGSAFVAWSDADYVSYRIAATQSGTSGDYYAELPADAVRYTLRKREATLALSRVFWEDSTIGIAKTAIAAKTAAEATLEAVEGIDPGNGSGDIPVDSTTLDANGDPLAAVDEDGNGVDDVAILAYVASEWSTSPTTAVARAQTRSQSDTTWQQPLMLDPGTYTIVYSKSGWDFPSTNVVVS